MGDPDLGDPPVHDFHDQMLLEYAPLSERIPARCDLSAVDMVDADAWPPVLGGAKKMKELGLGDSEQHALEGGIARHRFQGAIVFFRPRRRPLGRFEARQFVCAQFKAPLDRDDQRRRREPQDPTAPMIAELDHDRRSLRRPRLVRAGIRRGDGVARCPGESTASSPIRARTTRE